MRPFSMPFGQANLLSAVERNPAFGDGILLKSCKLLTFRYYAMRRHILYWVKFHTYGITWVAQGPHAQVFHSHKNCFLEEWRSLRGRPTILSVAGLTAQPICSLEAVFRIKIWPSNYVNGLSSFHPFHTISVCYAVNEGPGHHDLKTEPSAISSDVNRWWLLSSSEHLTLHPIWIGRGAKGSGGDEK